MISQYVYECIDRCLYPAHSITPHVNDRIEDPIGKHPFTNKAIPVLWNHSKQPSLEGLRCLLPGKHEEIHWETA